MHQGPVHLFVCSQKSTERQDKHDTHLGVGQAGSEGREGEGGARGQDSEHIV